MSDATCPFCHRIRKGEYTATPNGLVVTFEPLNPVTPGHRLFVTLAHVPRFQDGAVALGQAMTEAAVWARAHAAANLIVSSGPAATQTVPHIHVHLVPRHEGDGLMLPWSVS